MIFASNHQSALDIPVQVACLPPHTVFIAKKELSCLPIFGWAAALAGTLFVDRAKGTQNKALKQVKKLLGAGISMIVYPEGTRSRTKELLPFKRGAFVMAISAQVPVVPLTILNSGILCPKNKLFVHPGVIKIVVDKPIETKGMTIEQRFELSDRVHKLISSRLGISSQNDSNLQQTPFLVTKTR